MWSVSLGEKIRTLWGILIQQFFLYCSSMETKKLRPFKNVSYAPYDSVSYLSRHRIIEFLATAMWEPQVSWEEGSWEDLEREQTEWLKLWRYLWKLWCLYTLRFFHEETTGFRWSWVKAQTFFTDLYKIWYRSYLRIVLQHGCRENRPSYNVSINF
jgi:hypothetical protein